MKEIVCSRKSGYCKRLAALVGCLAIGACKETANDIPFKPSPDFVAAEATLYLKSPIPQKINHDAILLVSGQILTFERERLAPRPNAVVSILTNSDDLKERSKNSEQFRVLFSKSSKLVCIEEKCAVLLSICPPRAELERGQKCEYFIASEKGK